jgi:hypothetical protein
MEAININELDKKTKKKTATAYETKQIEVIPNFITYTVLILLVTNLIMGGVLYVNRGLLVGSWKAQIHALTAPEKTEAEANKEDNGGADVITSPKPTASPIVDSNSKGGCDLRFNELHEGVCYPLAQ